MINELLNSWERRSHCQNNFGNAVPRRSRWKRSLGTKGVVLAYVVNNNVKHWSTTTLCACTITAVHPHDLTALQLLPLCDNPVTVLLWSDAEVESNYWLSHGPGCVQPVLHGTGACPGQGVDGIFIPWADSTLASLWTSLIWNSEANTTVVNSDHLCLKITGIWMSAAVTLLFLLWFQFTFSFILGIYKKNKNSSGIFFFFGERGRVWGWF